MNKSVLTTVVCTLLVCQCVFAVDLVSDGNAVANIVVSSDADKVTLFAASELQKYLEQISTVKLAIEQSPKSKTAIYLGYCCSDVNSDLPPKPRYDGDDRFIIRTVDNNICIAGCSPRATLFAVYAFLEELGCCWPLPGKEYEVIPKLQKITWSQNEIKSEPAIAGRGMTLFPGNAIDDILDLTDWMAKNRFNFIYLHDRDLSAILPKLKEVLGCRDMGLEWGGHWLNRYLPRELFKEHPEYFRMENGKRTEKLNMCPSSPEAADIIARNSIKDWGKLRDFERFEALHLYPDDLDKGGWCSCEKCKGLTESDQALKIINEVARRLPLGDTSLVHASYHATISAPENIKPHKNVRLFYGPRERCYKHAMGECQINRVYLEHLKSQIPMFPNKPTAFEYYHDPYLFRTLPMPLYPVIGKDISVYRQVGVSRISSLSFVKFSKLAYGPNYYIFGKCLWRGEGDQRDIEEYCNAVYGPQSQAMKLYFDMIYEFCGTVMEVCGYKIGVNMRDLPYDQPFVKKQAALLAPLVTDENIEKIDSLLDGALAAAQEPYRGRIEEQRLLWRFARIDVPTIYRLLLASYLKNDINANSTDVDRQYVIAILKKALQDFDKATEILMSIPESMRGETVQPKLGMISERTSGNSTGRHRFWMEQIEKQLSTKQPAAQPQK